MFCNATLSAWPVDTGDNITKMQFLSAIVSLLHRLFSGPLGEGQLSATVTVVKGQYKSGPDCSKPD